MIEILNKSMEENIQQLVKGIEILGGASEVERIVGNDKNLVEYILEVALKGEVVKFELSNNEFSISEILSKKQEYEKYLLKNKMKAINAITYKINKYNTALDSLIRRYKKDRSIEGYNNIYKIISETYRRDINLYILKEFNPEIIEAISIEEEEKYYGEYLTQKKKQIIDSVISKLGIV